MATERKFRARWLQPEKKTLREFADGLARTPLSGASWQSRLRWGLALLFGIPWVLLHDVWQASIYVAFFFAGLDLVGRGAAPRRLTAWIASAPHLFWVVGMLALATPITWLSILYSRHKRSASVRT